MKNKDNVKEIAIGILVGIAVPGFAILFVLLVLWIDRTFGGRTAARVCVGLIALLVSAGLVFFVMGEKDEKGKYPVGALAGLLSFWNTCMILIMVFVI